MPLFCLSHVLLWVISAEKNKKESVEWVHWENSKPGPRLAGADFCPIRFREPTKRLGLNIVNHLGIKRPMGSLAAFAGCFPNRVQGAVGSRATCRCASSSAARARCASKAFAASWGKIRLFALVREGTLFWGFPQRETKGKQPMLGVHIPLLRQAKLVVGFATRSPRPFGSNKSPNYSSYQLRSTS